MEAMKNKNEDWRALAEEASNETDSGKLMKLVASLCAVLDVSEKVGKPPTTVEKALLAKRVS